MIVERKDQINQAVEQETKNLIGYIKKGIFSPSTDKGNPTVMVGKTFKNDYRVFWNYTNLSVGEEYKSEMPEYKICIVRAVIDMGSKPQTVTMAIS